ncbi:MAG: CIA30 family protein [Deltaproteobacteria bacterium]|nr:CIA30 family protein [Deltaproteobacteria bacterium]
MTRTETDSTSELIGLATQGSWRIVNDDVMGGRSDSNFAVADGRAVFEGNLSPDNGGGFASVRADLSAAPSPDTVAVVIRVRGDGKRYQFRVRTSEQRDGPAYKYEFSTTKGEWTTVRLPLAEFELSFRGRLIPDAPVIDAGRIRQVGFLIADRQWGRFRLEVESIRVEGGS